MGLILFMISLLCGVSLLLWIVGYAHQVRAEESWQGLPSEFRSEIEFERMPVGPVLATLFGRSIKGNIVWYDPLLLQVGAYVHAILGASAVLATLIVPSSLMIIVVLGCLIAVAIISVRITQELWMYSQRISTDFSRDA